MYPKVLYLKVVSAEIICEDTKQRSIGTRKTLTLRAEGEQLLVVKLISGLIKSRILVLLALHVSLSSQG